MVWLLLGSLLASSQDDAVEAKLGEVDFHRPPGTRSTVRYAPTFDRAVVSYKLRDRESFVLEGGKETVDPIKFLGWKLPEKKSVLLAGDERRRRLLVGGEEEKSAGDVWDAALVREGTGLALAVREGGGFVLREGGRQAGPFEEIELFGEHQGKLAYACRREGKRRFVVGDREFEVEGRPIILVLSPEGSRAAWVELLEGKKQRVVVDGKPGAACEQIHAGVFFSPNGKHVGYVTRDGQKYRGWVNGEELKSDQSIVTVRVLNSGTPVAVEMWSEPIKEPSREPGAPTTHVRGRLVVGGKREERVLARPVFNLDFQGELLYGASRTEEQSVLVWVSPAGEVRYQEVKGRVGDVLHAPEGGPGTVYTVHAKEGVFVHMEGRRIGPFVWADQFFYLEHPKKFGFVASKADKLQLIIGEKIFPVALTDLVPPVKVSKTELTVAVVGTQMLKNKKEIWVRLVQLD